MGIPREVEGSVRNPNIPAGRCGGAADPAPVNGGFQSPIGQARTRRRTERSKFYFSRIGLQRSSWRAKPLV